MKSTNYIPAALLTASLTALLTGCATTHVKPVATKANDEGICRYIKPAQIDLKQKCSRYTEAKVNSPKDCKLGDVVFKSGYADIALSKDAIGEYPMAIQFSGNGKCGGFRTNLDLTLRLSVSEQKAIKAEYLQQHKDLLNRVLVKASLPVKYQGMSLTDYSIDNKNMTSIRLDDWGDYKVEDKGDSVKIYGDFDCGSNCRGKGYITLGKQ